VCGRQATRLKTRSARQNRASQAADCADLLVENPHFIYADNTRFKTLARFLCSQFSLRIGNEARRKKAPPGRGF